MKVAGETWQKSRRTSPAAGSYIQPWITDIVIYLDFHSAKRALWLVDSWSRAPDQIQMYPDQNPDRDTIEQLLSARRTWSVHD